MELKPTVAALIAIVKHKLRNYWFMHQNDLSFSNAITIYLESILILLNEHSFVRLPLHTAAKMCHLKCVKSMLNENNI